VEAATAARLPVPATVLTAPRDAGAEREEHVRLLDAVVTGLFHAGLSLQAAAGPSADAAGQRTEAVLGELDDIIRQIRAAAFAMPAQDGRLPLPPAVLQRRRSGR
jgi:hypothetical protein